MVIHMPVAPNQPVAAAHFSEEGMRGKRGSIGEGVDGSAQLGAIAFPSGGRRSAFALLHFGPGRRAFRPGHGSVQSHPFEERPPDQIGG